MEGETVTEKSNATPLMLVDGTVVVVAETVGPVDGLVVKVNDNSTYQRLGVVGKAPRAAIASPLMRPSSGRN